MTKLLLSLAALSGFFAVALGAFAAHGLKARLEPSALAVFQTGVQYQMYHALALLAVALLLKLSGPSHWLIASGWLLVAGTVLFSGSLYALAFDAPRWLGPVTPLGGLCFLLGWLALVIAAVRLT